MKVYILIFTLIGSLLCLHSQTIVKMEVPPQAKEPLEVVVLFDEQVPEGMPVVLGLMGYSVTGGIEPYTYEWVQNGKVIGTGDVAIITPAKGDKFELKAIDKNRCFSVNSFSMKVIARIGSQDKEKGSEYKIFPTLVKNGLLHITLPDAESPLRANVRIFDTNGALKYQHQIIGSADVTCELAAGTYFVSVQTNDYHKVVKIIVQQ
ncbi:MAG: T9SS type A sorting domain-containing protein [Paludibacter sp.]